MQSFGFSFMWLGSIFIGNLGDKLQDIASSLRKPKVKKKGSDDISAVIQPDPAELQGRATGDILNSYLSHFLFILWFCCWHLFSDATIGSFCDMLEDFCGRAEVPGDDREEAEWLSLPAADLRKLVNEITSLRAKKLLNLIPVEVLVRLLRVLDHQIHRAEGLSIDECEHVSFRFFYSHLSSCRLVGCGVILNFILGQFTCIIFSF